MEILLNPLTDQESAECRWREGAATSTGFCKPIRLEVRLWIVDCERTLSKDLLLLAILPIHLVEKAGTVELVDETRFNESLRVGFGQFRTGTRQ